MGGCFSSLPLCYSLPIIQIGVLWDFTFERVSSLDSYFVSTSVWRRERRVATVDYATAVGVWLVSVFPFTFRCVCWLSIYRCISS
ncbi:hypothetical protein B0J14DRAFT_576213 [Halenospora varia]|nr:hypothetical protein B0J14DRAFT_576213 [Halenospora varia]